MVDVAAVVEIVENGQARCVSCKPFDVKHHPLCANDDEGIVLVQAPQDPVQGHI